MLQNFRRMKKTFLPILIGLLFFSACKKEKSNLAEVVNLTIEQNPTLPTKSVGISKDEGKIFIFIDKELTKEHFPLALKVNIEISKGAKTNATNSLNFSTADEVKEIRVLSENGHEKKWLIYLVHHQLQNTNFRAWFDNKGMNSKNYKEIGESLVKSVWGTANMGTSIYGIYCTKPASKGVIITTQKAPIIPITAGTLFTGKFDLDVAIKNPTKPESAVSFGTPFVFIPKKMKIKYQYTPGKQLIQAKLKNPDNLFDGFTTEEIKGEEDECDMYVYLENRNGNEPIRIAEGALELGKKTEGVIKQEIEIKRINQELEPTHIIVVFASSKYGNQWKGAVGSQLSIDEFKLIY